MSIQSIHDWSSIKHIDYSSPVLRECHQQANMATRRPDVENNLSSNQVNISRAKLISARVGARYLYLYLYLYLGTDFAVLVPVPVPVSREQEVPCTCTCTCR